MNFPEQLAAAWQKNDSLLCVGLDPDHKNIAVAKFISATGKWTNIIG